MHRDYILAAASGVFALVGVAAGSLLSAHYAERQFNQQIRVAQREKLMVKRLEVMEQCIRARANLGRAKMIMELIKVDELAILLNANNKEPSREATQRKTTYDSYEHQREFNEIRTNFATCVQMAAVFFGPKTKEAALNLNKVKVWYEDMNSTELASFTDAMLSEANHREPGDEP